MDISAGAPLHSEEEVKKEITDLKKKLKDLESKLLPLGEKIFQRRHSVIVIERKTRFAKTSMSFSSKDRVPYFKAITRPSIVVSKGKVNLTNTCTRHFQHGRV